MPTEPNAARPDISSSERTVSGIAAGVLGVMALRTPSRARRTLWLSLASLLSVRAATGRSRLYRALDLSGAHLADGGGNDITASATVARPRQEVYEFWRDARNLASAMSHAEEIRPLGDGTTHWRVRGPANIPIEWDAEMLDDHPGELLSWRSLEGSEIEHAGSVRFKDADGGSATEVLLRMRYRVPGGGPAQFGARLRSSATNALIREELERVGRALETTGARGER